MGINLPQLAPASTDRVSGASVIDGSLKFDKDKNHYLSRTPSSDGNRNNWTISCWIKRGKIGTANQRIFETANNFAIRFGSDNFQWLDGASGANGENTPAAVLRDTGWYHCVFAWDSSAGVYGNRIYVNGVELDYNQTGGGNPNTSSGWNVGSSLHTIGANQGNTGRYYDGMMTQCYFVDGLTLGPGYFGFTDPLTGTWRPRKFEAEGTTVNDGRVFSSTGTFSNWDDDGSYPRTELFDGTIYTGGTPNGASPDDGNPATFDFGDQQITGFQNLKINIFISSNQVGASNLASVNGVDITREIHNAGNNTWTMVDLGSKFTSLKSFSIKNNNCYVGGFVIDGVVVKDSTTQNLSFGTNGFYLPMDGNSPIGEDKSGNGNNWTPVNFGGSADITKATGALPILNTLGGTVARPGVLGSEVSANYTTTSNTAAGSGYEFDQTSGFNPSLSFVRGATYTFDYTDSSSHPLRFSSTDPDSSVTSYTDGTNTSVSNTVKITVPHNAPDTLYYYCTSHNSMNGRISVTTDTKKADPYAWKCVFAVPFAGSANDVSAAINCTTSNHTATVSGSVASSAQSNFYNNSFFFDGTDDTVSYAHSEDFHIGASDFTIEGWVWKDNKGSRQSWIGQRDGGSTEWRILFDYLANPDADSEGAVRMEWGSSQLVFTSNALKHSQWNHVAMVRSGTTGTLYINGISIGTQTLNDIGDYAADLYIGQQISTGGENYQGYMNDIRIYKGVAKYTSNFIPASTNPDILPDTPSGVGTKTQLTKITDGAVSFDGTGDYLTLANSSDFSFGSGDFTIEAYVRWNDLSGTGSVVGVWQSSNTRRSWLLQCSGSNTLSALLSSDGGTGGSIKQCDATGVLREKTWHHCAFTRSGNNIRLFIDGKLKATTDVTGFSVYDNTNDSLTIGSFRNDGAGDPIDGFISNVRVIKGTALYTSDFTPPTRELTNVTNTKLLCCQSNTSATAAAVTPGSITANGNASATNFNPFTTDINTVRGQEGTYCTLSPLMKSQGTLSNGNLKLSISANGSARGSLNVTSGKYYMEMEITTSGNPYFGIGSGYPNISSNHYIAPNAITVNNTGDVYLQTSSQSYPGKSTQLGTGTFMCAFDVDAKKIWWGKNGQWHRLDGSTANLSSSSSRIESGLDSTSFSALDDSDGFTPHFGNSSANNTTYDNINFGQKPFKFPPPDGFQPLTSSSTARPDTVITRPDQYVKATTYTGNGASTPSGSGGTQTINVGFKPDLIWIKDRTQAHNNNLIDSVNGAPNLLMSDLTNGLTTDSTDGLTAITDNGFTLGDNGEGTQSLEMNKNGNNYVAWTWKAGGGKSSGGGFFKDDVEYGSAAAAGLDGGTIDPIGASVGTKQGFSILKWTGTSGNGTLSHGLTEAPNFVIVKANYTGGNWPCYHSGLTDATKYIWLNSTSGENTQVAAWNSTAPTSNLFHVGGEAEVNRNGYTSIAYLWHDVPGLQKFGTYAGISSADGPFIELGFKPALIMLKKINNVDSNSGWHIYDNRRNTYNAANNFLLASHSYYENRAANNTADVTTYTVDFLSNGFKLRHNSNNLNDGGSNYIYAAWAEAPAFNLYGAQSNAR